MKGRTMKRRTLLGAAVTIAGLALVSNADAQQPPIKIGMLRLVATSRAVVARFCANSWSAVSSATVLPPAF